LVTSFDGRVKVGKLDVDSNSVNASSYRIRSIPALFFLKDGKVVDRVVGVVSKKNLKNSMHCLKKARVVDKKQ